jgi:hypothetical protein
VRLHVKGEEEAKAWRWPARLQEAMGWRSLEVRKEGEE